LLQRRVGEAAGSLGQRRAPGRRRQPRGGRQVAPHSPPQGRSSTSAYPWSARASVPTSGVTSGISVSQWTHRRTSVPAASRSIHVITVRAQAAQVPTARAPRPLPFTNMHSGYSGHAASASPSGRPMARAMAHSRRSPGGVPDTLPRARATRRGCGRNGWRASRCDDSSRTRQTSSAF